MYCLFLLNCWYLCIVHSNIIVLFTYTNLHSMSVPYQMKLILRNIHTTIGWVSIKLNETSYHVFAINLENQRIYSQFICKRSFYRKVWKVWTFLLPNFFHVIPYFSQYSVFIFRRLIKAIWLDLNYLTFL